MVANWIKWVWDIGEPPTSIYSNVKYNISIADYDRQKNSNYKKKHPYVPFIKKLFKKIL